MTALVAGGVGGHVRMLARGLVAAGHQVLVACPQEVAQAFELERTGATVVPVEVGSGLHPARDPKAVRHLRRLAAGADVVHAHGVRAGALSALALLAARRADLGRTDASPVAGPPRGADHALRRAPLVVTMHNAPPTDRRSALVYGVLERLVHARADLVLGVSPDLVDRARARGAGQAGLAVVPAEPSRLVPAHRRGEVRAAVRAELGLVDGQLLLLTVGRLGAQKRTVEVVAAYQSYVEREAGGTSAGSAWPAEVCPQVVLAVAGDGPDRVDVAAQAASGPGRVHLLGRRDDVPELLAAADVVVSGAQWEGQPLWLQEALGAGVPVVATDVGGTRVVVGDAAVLVPVGEDGGGMASHARVRALREALRAVLVDAQLRSTLADRALRRARELPTAAEAVEAAETAYARVRGTAYPDRVVGPTGT
ncbi:glycosyltransferase family 4 protein [Ornithinimicrobium sufpigmenti]|uniref:glycosyltransferase family 4 protein n=1 Tax=Ornithinimicrobium sufpigmenti TaxID=2508882 RepID=UPI00192DAE12|nr:MULTISPECIES: glycosyltransferase family 4 protein [unclassified Ornithinimicrobium]